MNTAKNFTQDQFENYQIEIRFMARKLFMRAFDDLTTLEQIDVMDLVGRRYR